MHTSNPPNLRAELLRSLEVLTTKQIRSVQQAQRSGKWTYQISSKGHGTDALLLSELRDFWLTRFSPFAPELLAHCSWDRSHADLRRLTLSHTLRLGGSQCDRHRLRRRLPGELTAFSLARSIVVPGSLPELITICSWVGHGFTPELRRSCRKASIA